MNPHLLTINRELLWETGPLVPNGILGTAYVQSRSSLLDAAERDLGAITH
jgi:hypothetical protein